MAKLVDRIQEALTPQLEPGEKLRSVGQVTSGKMSTAQAMVLTGGIGYLTTVKNWWVGVTEKRAVFVQLTAFSKPSDVRFSVPLTSVRLTGKGMAVVAVDELDVIRLVVAKKGDSRDFKFHFGAKFASGLDVKEFTAALMRR
jgi:hypothetical protein